jgi:hypothetical protein
MFMQIGTGACTIKHYGIVMCRKWTNCAENGQIGQKMGKLHSKLVFSFFLSVSFAGFDKCISFPRNPHIKNPLRFIVQAYRYKQYKNVTLPLNSAI